MSHLNQVLRRSIAHLDPSDRTGREAAFASARDKMMRLLSAYEPPLTAMEIETKIDEFDATIRAITAEFDSVRRATSRTAPLSAVGGPTPSAPRASAEPARPAPVRAEPVAAPPPPAAPSHPVIETPPADRWESSEDRDVEPHDEAVHTGPDEDSVQYDEEFTDYDDSVAYDADGEAAAYDDDPEAYGDDDLYYDDEAEPHRPSFLDRIHVRGIALALLALVVLGMLLGGGVYLYRRSAAQPATTAPAALIETPATEPPPSEPVASASPVPPQQSTTPSNAMPAASTPPPKAAAAAPAAPGPGVPAAAVPDPGAVETLVLFDGRDPSAFQSAPDNPVRFQGDTEGGFAEIGSSTGSTGARLLVGRGVYERIAGRRIRVVVVARASRDTPASVVRFAYQNGRTLSPWSDMKLAPGYGPLSMTWSVPKERSGPDRDLLIIEPGIPGDETAADIRQVRIEVLS